MGKEKMSLVGYRKPWFAMLFYAVIIMFFSCLNNIIIPVFSGDDIEWVRFFYPLFFITIFTIFYIVCRVLSYKTKIFKKMTDRDALLKFLIGVILVLSMIVSAIMYNMILSII